MTAAAVEYNRAIDIVRGDNVEERLTLASNPSTPPEFLYYLCDDPDVGVRRAVGENPSTPNKADAKLSKDDDISVRCAVARKIVGDGLDAASRRDMWRMGFTILETLMRDNVVKVRRILSQALKSDAEAPHQMVLGLARDRDEDVAAPVLRESPVLTDEDMMSIIEGGSQGWAQEAIAGRDDLSPALADKLIERGEARTVARVIANPGSRLSEPTLEKLVDRSETVKELQPPLVGRKNMSGGLLGKLARFVAQPLLQTLCGRTDLDEQSARAINGAIEARDDKPEVRATATKQANAPSGAKSAKGKTLSDRLSEIKSIAAKPSRAKPSGSKQGDSKQGDAGFTDAGTPEARARGMFKRGTLTDEIVAAALDRWESNFVMEALALRAGYPAEKVRRMVRVKSARTIVALAWKAGFSARFAMDLQRQLANIMPTKIINARDGVDYALTAKEMENQLSLFD
jgi:uncharacterized protein (DUF2336 family)